MTEMVMLKRTIGFESTSQETLTVCLMAALIIVDSEEHTGGSLIEIDKRRNCIKTVSTLCFYCLRCNYIYRYPGTHHTLLEYSKGSSEFVL